MVAAQQANGQPIAVIGAGIVGVSAALWLQRDGEDVVLIDRLGPGEGTSYGNAGVLASCSVVPVTAPGLVAKAPRMAFDRDSPLFLRWSYLPRMLPWLWRYLSHCTPAANRRIAAALAPVIGDSLEQHLAMAKGTPAERWLRTDGYNFAYRDRAAFEADAFGWELRKAHGFTWEVREGDAVRDFEPNLGDDVGLLVCVGDHGHITDPGRYVKDLAAVFAANGGRVRTAEVRDFRFAEGGLAGLETSAGPLACRAAVVATGAWSGGLCAKLGLKVPLETERGYHIELEDPSLMPRAPTSLTWAKFVASPMDGRLRCAGIVEFGGLAAPPSRAPFALLQRQVKQAFPGLRWSAVKEWMGHRPAPSDSIPLIGPVPNRPGVHLAFGHHHVGLTGGPKTGRLVADLIAGRRPNIDLAPYRPDRFR
jgi:D-amino-acid dehydrogenase